MNYLSHYICDRKLNSPWYNVGLMYPDLFRELVKKREPLSFFKSNKMRDLDLHFKDSDGVISDFHLGIAMHFKRDADFHHSDFFRIAQERVKEYFLLHHFNEFLPRLYFAVHVVTEWIIDREIIRLCPIYAHQMYEDMHNVLMDKGFNRKVFSTIDMDKFFFDKLNRIWNDKYIFAHLNNVSFVLNLFNMYTKTGVKISLPMHKDEYIMQKWNHFFDEMRGLQIFDLKRYTS
jgi:hypothetical protein